MFHQKKQSWPLISVQRLLIQWLGFMAFIAAISVPCRSSADSSSGTQAEQFKDFIQNPPPIKGVYVEIRQPNQPPSFYIAKWQANGEFIAMGNGLASSNLLVATNLTDYYAVYSRFGDIYWQKVGRDLYCWTNLHLPRQETNSITFGHNNNVHWVVNQALNAGMDELPVASIKWNEDSFSCTNIPGHSYQGLLSRDANNRAKSLELNDTLLNHGKPESWETTYDYFYDAPLEVPFFPSRIETTLNDSKGNSYRRSVIIHSIQLASDPMPATDFALGSLLGTTNTTVLFTISNNLIVSTPVGHQRGAVVGVAQDPMAAAIARKPPFRIAFFLIAGLMTLAPIMIYVVERRKKNKNEKNI